MTFIQNGKKTKLKINCLYVDNGTLKIGHYSAGVFGIVKIWKTLNECAIS